MGSIHMHTEFSNDGLLAAGDFCDTELHVVSFARFPFRGSVLGLLHSSCVGLQWRCRQQKKVGRNVIKNTIRENTIAVTIKVAAMLPPIPGHVVTLQGTAVYIKNKSSINREYLLCVE